MVMDYFEFSDYGFYQRQDFIRVVFKRYYYFEIPISEFEEIGKYHIKEGQIGFDNTDKVGKKFLTLLDKYLRNKLVHTLNGKRTVFIDEDSEIPLIGTNEFGIIDRNTSVIEMKPLTGCNHSCIFCSVDEGKNKKNADYLVDCDYLIKEVEKIACLKKHPVEINIGPQGEPLLYPDIVELVKRLKQIDNIYFVSMNSNGSILTKKLVDELCEAGLGRINLSINSLNKQLEDKLSGVCVNIDNLLSVLEYAKDKIEIMPAPVIVFGLNDSEKNVSDLIKLGVHLKKNFPYIGIQNYLEYKEGRTPVKEKSMTDFYKWLEEYEKKTGIKLKLCASDFNIFEDKVLEKPFFKDDVVKATIKCPGRKKNEVICSYLGRAITVKGCSLEKGSVKIRIVRDKHNIFVGVPV